MTFEDELMNEARRKRAELAGMSYMDKQAETARRLEQALYKQTEGQRSPIINIEEYIV